MPWTFERECVAAHSAQKWSHQAPGGWWPAVWKRQPLFHHEVLGHEIMVLDDVDHDVE